MIELKYFYHDGFGWICRRCESLIQDAEISDRDHSRFFSEGEAENKTPELSTRALAKWTDPTRQALVCPRCRITEAVERP
jgi:hypothetical protein